jgi:ATP-dependent DNA helicase RecG
VVVDEQHRFGVNQRALLKNKGINPHLLTMTATPIPRTIALTIYGELNLSVIDEMPVGRLPVKTFVVPKEKRLAGYQWIKKQIQKKGVQVFIVCPLIEESTKETMSSVKAATKEYEYLKSKIFPELKIGLLHGKIPGKKKDQIMTDFKNKQYDILVSTSVVEVGIDISNANIIMIEGAERYGLAQLHQLRGRVGRGKEQAYCFVFTETDNKDIQDRLNYFARNNSGLKLAEYDLQNRGPGNIFGTKQHGYVDLKIALLNDYKLIEQTKRGVDYFTKKYSVEDFPILKKRLSAYRTSLISSD